MPLQRKIRLTYLALRETIVPRGLGRTAQVQQPHEDVLAQCFKRRRITLVNRKENLVCGNNCNGNVSSVGVFFRPDFDAVAAVWRWTEITCCRYADWSGLSLRLKKIKRKEIVQEALFCGNGLC
jgi:hypothetical protein